MRHVLEASEMLGLVETSSGVVEICASAGATYDELTSQLKVELGVILRPIDNYGLGDYVRITVGNEAENNRVLEALKATLAGAS